MPDSEPAHAGTLVLPQRGKTSLAVLASLFAELQNRAKPCPLGQNTPRFEPTPHQPLSTGIKSEVFLVSEHKNFFGKRAVSIYSEQMAELTEAGLIIFL
ncbi:MAG: hypothetical protein KKH11_04155 [Candidatus Omnitrophica bacterium]|nr:hypothetical protein [Candidatus Omnitrophota bacterium]